MKLLQQVTQKNYMRCGRNYTMPDETRTNHFIQFHRKGHTYPAIGNKDLRGISLTFLGNNCD